MTHDRVYFLQLDDKRQLCYQEFGDNAGVPFFYFHGLPGSRLECGLLAAAAQKHRLYIMAVDRPGYGGSSPQPDRTLLDWPQQITLLANHLGWHRFGIVEVSGGAPYALACARYIPDRLLAVGVKCGLAPLATTDLLAAMHWYARIVIGLAAKNRSPVLRSYAALVSLLAQLSARAMIRLLGLLNGGADKQVLKQPAVTATLAATMHAAFQQGSAGVLADLAVCSQPWGFDLTDITMPVEFWHGVRDPLVPIEHGEYVYQQINGSSLTRVQNEGHFSLPILHADVILAELKTKINTITPETSRPTRER